MQNITKYEVRTKQLSQMPYTLDDIRKICSDDNIILSSHTKNRFIERNISYKDVYTAILNGEIIEEYPDDTPFPSCLICAQTDSGYIHTVISTDNTYIYIITAYRPSLDKWEKGFRSRKRGNKI